MADAGAIHREMFEVVLAHDFDRLRELLHRDYVYMDGSGQEQGIEAGVEVAETYTRAFADLHFTIRNQFTPTEDVSIIEFTAEGTQTEDMPDIPATGKQIRVVGCNVIQVRGDRIVRENEYYDNVAIMTQLGLMPT